LVAKGSAGVARYTFCPQDADTFFVRQARGGGREGPESWAGCRRLPPKDRADLVRPLGAGAGQKTKGGGRSPRARGAQGAPRLSEGKPNAKRGEGAPSLTTRQRQWRSTRREAPLAFAERVACGETPRLPLWVGQGARAFLGRK
jgi:hypothetical protein